MVNAIGYIITYVVFVATINLIAGFGYSDIGTTEQVSAPPSLELPDYGLIPIVEESDDSGLDALVDLLTQFLNIVIYIITIIVTFLYFAGEIAIWLVTFQSLEIFGLAFEWRAFIAIVLNTGFVLAIVKLLRG